MGIEDAGTGGTDRISRRPKCDGREDPTANSRGPHVVQPPLGSAARAFSLISSQPCSQDKLLKNRTAKRGSRFIMDECPHGFYLRLVQSWRRSKVYSVQGSSRNFKRGHQTQYLSDEHRSLARSLSYPRILNTSGLTMIVFPETAATRPSPSFPTTQSGPSVLLTGFTPIQVFPV
jgi:hypothetical protein